MPNFPDSSSPEGHSHFPHSEGRSFTDSRRFPFSAAFKAAIFSVLSSGCAEQRGEVIVSGATPLQEGMPPSSPDLKMNEDILWLMSGLVEVAPIHRVDYGDSTDKDKEREAIIAHITPALKETAKVIDSWIQRENSEYPDAPPLRFALPPDQEQAQVLRVWIDDTGLSSRCDGPRVAIMPHVDRMFAPTLAHDVDFSGWQDNGWPAAPNKLWIRANAGGALDLVGRGTNDDLAGVVQGLIALERFRHTPAAQKGDLCVELVIDTKEEVGTELPSYLEKSDPKPDYVLVPDGCADRSVVEKAVYRQKITVTPRQQGTVIPRSLTLGIGHIGERINQIPSQGEIVFDFKGVDEHAQTFEDAAQWVEDILKGMREIKMVTKGVEETVSAEFLLVDLKKDTERKKITLRLAGPGGHGSQPCYVGNPKANPIITVGRLIDRLAQEKMLTEDHAVATLRFIAAHFGTCEGLQGGAWDETPSDSPFGAHSTTYNPTKVSWGTEGAEIEFDLRTGVSVDPAGHDPNRYLNNFVSSAGGFPTGHEVKVETISKSPPLIYKPGSIDQARNEAERAWDDSVRFVMNREPRLARVTGRTDGAKISSASPNSQVVVSGPGTAECDAQVHYNAIHGVGEYIPLQEVDDATRIVLRWLEELPSSDETYWGPSL